MSTPEPPGGPADQPWAPGGGPGGPDLPPYVPVSPLLPDDPPRVGGYWLDARLSATPAGVAFTAHDEQNTAGDAAPAVRGRRGRCRRPRPVRR